MPCICELFLRNKNCPKHKESTSQQYLLNPTSTKSKPAVIDPDRSSASVEVANLRAQLWSLSVDLSESVSCAHNLQDIVTATVQEKYELIDQLSESQLARGDMKTQLSVEREFHATDRKDLLNEIYFLKGQLDDRTNLFVKVSNQNIELKRQLFEANETIARMGEMYLKMKLSKDSVRAANNCE